MINLRTKPFSAFLCIFLLITITCWSENWISVVPARDLGDYITKSGSADDYYVLISDDAVIVSGRNLAQEVFRNDADAISKPLDGDEQVILMMSKDPNTREINFPGVRQVYSGHGFRILLANETAKAGLSKYISECTLIEPMPRNEVLVTPLRHPERNAVRNPFIKKLLQQIDHDAWKSDIRSLVELNTRYTYAPESELALRYIEEQLAQIGLESKRHAFTSASQKSYNIVATLPGIDPANSKDVLIFGHLDSISPRPMVMAPGADDNASGVAGVLALARLAANSGLKFNSNIRFIFFMGEEIGLLGSRAYVASLSSEELRHIKTAINMDMIGWDAIPPLSLLLETARFNSAMADRFADIAANYTSLSTQISLRPFGSDHVPFLNRQVPCILTIEAEYDTNPHYHQTTDTYEILNLDLIKQTIFLNAVVMLKDAGIVLETLH